MEAGRSPGPEIIERLKLTIEQAEETRRQAVEMVAMSKRIYEEHRDGAVAGA